MTRRPRSRLTAGQSPWVTNSLTSSDIVRELADDWDVAVEFRRKMR